MMNGVEWMVLGGFALIEAAYVPQIVRLYRRKEADAISVFFPSINLLGRLLVVTHTISVNDFSMTAGLLLGVLLRTTLVLQVLTYRFGKKRAPAAQR